MKKTLLVLALIVLFIPVITFANDVPPGQPFQQLQNQINTINSQLENLKRQLQDVGNKAIMHDNEIDQLTTSFEKLSTQVSALGVTHVIHGRSGENGEWLAGQNWTPLSHGETGCANYYEYVISLNSMTDPAAPPPHCAVVLSWDQSDPLCYLEFSVKDMRVTTYNIGMVVPIWVLSVQMRRWRDIFTTLPLQSQFDFICVQ